VVVAVDKILQEFPRKKKKSVLANSRGVTATGCSGSDCSLAKSGFSFYHEENNGGQYGVGD